MNGFPITKKFSDGAGCECEGEGCCAEQPGMHKLVFPTYPELTELEQGDTANDVKWGNSGEHWDIHVSEANATEECGDPGHFDWIMKVLG